MTFDELFVHGADAAKAFFEDTGEVMPMWIGQDVNGDMNVLSGIMPDTPAKSTLADFLKIFFQERKIIQYVSMLESWMVKIDLNQSDAKGEDYLHGRKKPSESPDRMEVILIQAESNDGRVRSGLFYIQRENGQKPTLSPLTDLGGGLATGTFADLLVSTSKQ